MNRLLRSAGTLFVLLTVICIFVSPAQKKKTSAKKMPSQEEMMARWKEFMTPTDAHKKLEYFVGTWDMTTEAWMAGPNQPPETSKGTATYSMILGGRYLQENVSGEMMKMPFNGIGITGYDNFKKKYFGTWIDDMGTSVATMEGTIDPDGKVITLWGKMDEPATGEKNKTVKYVYKIVDNNTHLFEIYDVTSHGEKYPTMRVTYKRKV